jgi:hypothetical protein
MTAVVTLIARTSIGPTLGGIGLLGLIVLLALVGTRLLLVRLRARKEPLPPEQVAVAAATDELRAVHKSFRTRLSEAQKTLKTEERGQSKTVKAAEKKLKAVQTPPYLGHAGGIKIYEDRVLTPEGVHPMDERIQAVVDTAGNMSVTRRHTLTRFALIGVFSIFTPKSTKHDTRELYFLVEHPEWASVVKLDPNAGVSARKVCASLNVAARQASTNRANRQRLIADAKAQLDGVRGDRVKLEQAEASVHEACAAFSQIATARERVEKCVSMCAEDSSVVKRARRAIARADADRPSTSSPSVQSTAATA